MWQSSGVKGQTIVVR